MLASQKCIPLLLAAALIGCGDSGPELGEVEGVVTLDGKPLSNAVVTFSPQGGGPNGIAKTGTDGKYQLMTAGKLGAVLGGHKVSIIVVPEDPPPMESIPSDDPRYQERMNESSATYRPPPVTPVPERYNVQTELTEQVESGSNTIDFDLKS